MRSRPVTPNDKALPLLALRRREGGDSYARVGEALGVSKGKAYHLVKEARAECYRKAQLIPRGPSKETEPSLERAEEILWRLRHDVEVLDELASEHLGSAALAGQCDRFDSAAERLEELIHQDGGRKTGLKEALIEATEAFHAILEAAATSCDGYSRHIDYRHNLEAFHADALMLGRFISPRSKVELPGWEPSVDLDARRDRAVRKGERLNRKEREARNLAIVSAALHGTANHGEIAAEHGLSPRQVGRIVKEFKASATPATRRDARGAGAAIAARLRALSGTAVSGRGDSPRQIKARSRQVLNEFQALRDIGAVPAGGYPELVAQQTFRRDKVRELALAMREALEFAEIDKAVIESVTELPVRILLEVELDVELERKLAAIRPDIV